MQIALNLVPEEDGEVCGGIVNTSMLLDIHSFIEGQIIKMAFVSVNN